MNRNEGLLVVDRLGFMRSAMPAGRLTGLRRDDAPEAVFRRYRGFDGIAWPVAAHPQFATDEGLADLADRLAVEAYVRSLPNAADCDLLLLVRADRPDFSKLRRAGWCFAGFDVGFFESEWSHFSVVLNEVIWGTLPELVSFTDGLGPHLLFEHLDDALALASAHKRIADGGGDVEEGEVRPIGVYVAG